MSDETTPPRGSDESAQPPAPEERPSTPETGWPAATAPPTWADVEDVESTSDEEELDALLDAQDVEPAALSEQPTAEAQPNPAAEPDDAADGAEAAPEAPELSAVAGAGVPEPTDEAEVDAAVAEPHDEAPEPTVEHDAELPEASVDEAESPTEAVEPADHPTEPVVKHGADQDAAELASAALFTSVPAEVVAPEEAEPEPGIELTAPAAGEPAVPGERSATVVVALLVALVLVLAGLTAFLAQRSVSTRGGGGVEDARHDGLQAARSAARLVFSYDYRHLDKDFAAGKAQTTGKFADQYGTTTPKLVEVAKTYKAVVAADVSDAAVITASTGKVVVLVFVNQQSTSTLAAAPKITQSRVTMTMLHRHGRWLVSDVHAF